MDAVENRCPQCGRLFFAPKRMSFTCCDEKLTVKRSGKTNRREGRVSPLPICMGHGEHERCEHWGKRGGSEGCLLCPGKPCDIGYHLRTGAGCFDSSAPKFEPVWNISNPFYGPWLTYDDLRHDVAEFTQRVAAMGFEGVVGVPRSGMLVANEIAVRLGLPLYTLGPEGIHRLSTGLRLRGAKDDVGKLLVTEDSTASGRSIREARQWVGDRPDTYFAAVYATSNGADGVDLYHRKLELPHWFEWNLIGNPCIPIGTDFDGILCPDFTPAEDDDGPRYLERMESMPCLIHPGPASIQCIITARLEKYRYPTEQWLARHRIPYDKLVMGPWATQAERSKIDIGRWKAEQCKQHGVNLFLESCPHQSRVIANLVVGLAVICPQTKTTFVR